MQQNNHELWPVTVCLVSFVCLRARRCLTERCGVWVNEGPPPLTSPKTVAHSLAGGGPHDIVAYACQDVHVWSAL